MLGRAIYGLDVRLPLADGDAGTMQTLAAMRAVIHDAAESAHVRGIAAGLAAGKWTGRDVADAVFYWVKPRCRFQADPPGVEHLRHPHQLLSEISAAGVALCDCDDVSMLTAAILTAANLTAVLTVCAREPGPFEHVYTGVLIGGERYALDPQEFASPGEEAPAVRRHTIRV